jgi:hypothetical protein
MAGSRERTVGHISMIKLKSAGKNNTCSAA